MLNDISDETAGIFVWYITALYRNNRTGLLRISVDTRSVMILWNGALPELISVA